MRTSEKNALRDLPFVSYLAVSCPCATAVLGNGCVCQHPGVHKIVGKGWGECPHRGAGPPGGQVSMGQSSLELC